jgi:hypothetical protein
MSPEGRNDHPHQNARTGVEQREDPRHREAAPDRLIRGLAKRLLEARCVRHAHSRSIDEPGSMPPPATRICERTNGGGKAFEQSLKQGQREPGPGLAIRRSGERLIGESSQVSARGVAMKNLQNK